MAIWTRIRVRNLLERDQVPPQIVIADAFDELARGIIRPCFATRIRGCRPLKVVQENGASTAGGGTDDNVSFASVWTGEMKVQCIDRQTTVGIRDLFVQYQQTYLPDDAGLKDGNAGIYRRVVGYRAQIS
jgi:hypothetical protein